MKICRDCEEEKPPMKSAISMIEIEEPTTDAELDARKSSGRGTDKIWLPYNAISVIGALVFIEAARKRRNCNLRPVEPHHIQAAALFRHHWETAGYALKASDTSLEPVDKSSTAHDSGMGNAVDKRRKQASGIRQLGYRSQLVVDCVCREITLPKMVTDRNKGVRLSKRDLEQRCAEMGDEILACLDELSEHWGGKTHEKRAA